jgi:hypothetical protein
MVIIGRYCVKEEGMCTGIVMLVCIYQVVKTGTNFHEMLDDPYAIVGNSEFVPNSV